MFPFPFLVAMLSGWLRHEQDNIIAFLREENRVLKARLKGGDCDWMTPSAAAWPNWDIELGVACSGRSRPL